MFCLFLRFAFDTHAFLVPVVVQAPIPFSRTPKDIPPLLVAFGILDVYLNLSAFFYCLLVLVLHARAMAFWRVSMPEIYYYLHGVLL